MGEILFRGKRKDNGEWVEGCLVYDSQHCSIRDSGYEYFEVAPETVGQFTGMTDRDGKKIFEGNILKVVTQDTKEERYIQVCIGEFSDYDTDDLFIGVYLKFDDYTVSGGQIKQYSGDVEVVGNIHDKKV